MPATRKAALRTGHECASALRPPPNAGLAEFGAGGTHSAEAQQQEGVLLAVLEALATGATAPKLAAMLMTALGARDSQPIRKPGGALAPGWVGGRGPTRAGACTHSWQAGWRGSTLGTVPGLPHLD